MPHLLQLLVLLLRGLQQTLHRILQLCCGRSQLLNLSTLCLQSGLQGKWVGCLLQQLRGVPQACSV